jgi:DNA modification methylase
MSDSRRTPRPGQLRRTERRSGLRRALSAEGGPVTSNGEPRLARLLAEALRVPADAESQELTHGFHAYPARFHPLLCRRLLAAHPASATVLDPFSGSGTTLVEATVRGCLACGSDINPLGVELGWLKTGPFSDGERAQLRVRALAVADRSRDRVRRRARTHSSGEQYDDPRRYAPHVFRELVGLREVIGTEREAPLRRALLLVLSAILIKVSRQRAVTDGAVVERAIGKGLPTRLFERKALELVARLDELANAIPAGTPQPQLRRADARALGHVANASVDVILTSPPYLGTYDYAEQHAQRLGWLGLDPKVIRQLEIGARRHSTRDPGQALLRWQSDVDDFVAEFARVLRPGGVAYLVIGDSAMGDQVVAGDVAIRAAAKRAGLSVPASAVQVRPNFYARARRAERREHLLALTSGI